MVELPTDAEKPTHTRPSGIRSSKPLVPPVELLLPPTVPTGLSFFLLLFSFLVPIASFPQGNFAPGSPRNDDRQLGRPTTSPVLSLLMRIPFPKVDRCRHLIASKEIFPFSHLRCTAFPAVSSASSYRQRFRSESQLVDQDSQGYEFCACGTGRFNYFPGRSSKKTDSDDRRQSSVQLMAAASICVQLRAEAHWDQSILGTNMGPKPRIL